MNRQALAEATSLHDGPVPVYLMEEIANSTKGSDRDAEKTADYMLGRLNKSNLTVKLKALQIISFCIREGAPAFREAIRDEEQEISAYLQFSGPPDPVYGDEKYRRIRVASQEALVCLNDGFLSRRNEEPPQQQQQPPQGAGNSWQAQQGDNASSYNNSNGSYNQGGQSERQHSNVGGSWGQPQANSSRPAPYQDNPSGGYNGPSGGGYNGPSGNSGYGGGNSGYSGGNSNYGGGNSSYGGGSSGYSGGNSGYGGGSSGYGGGNSYGQNSGNSGGYGQSGSQGGYGQNSAPQQQQQQASGFSSWSSSSSSGLASKSAGAGVWSSTGYQKKDPAMENEPRYNPATRRDNRPTVLVGHSLNFPKPAGGFGSSNTGATSGLGGFNSGTYNPNAVRGASAGNAYNPNASSGNAYNPNASSGSAYNPNSMGGSARGGFGGNSSSTPSYIDNTNRMLSGSTHRIGSMGLPVNGQPLSDAPTTALGKKAEVLMKMGSAALEKWDRRNMDKSMASSLADHDELRAGPQVIDHGHYQPNAQGAGGGDTSRDYERTMIDNLCAPAGLSRAPPADGLKRFVDLAQTLDAQTIGDILLDKLEDDTWQVRLKGLHVVLALLDSPGAAPYQEFFEENVEVVEELRKDGKPSVVSKALQVLRALGYADEVDQAPSQTSSKRSARAQRGSPTKSRGQQPQQEVDLLGFGSLSLESSACPAQPPVQVTADLLGSPVRSQPPPAPAPPQEISLLDGFDTLGSSTSSNPSYAPQQQVAPPQQQFYQQPEQDERNKALSHFGKDLFAIANSPRSAAAAGTAPPPGGDGTRLSGGQSAFNFM